MTRNIIEFAREVIAAEAGAVRALLEIIDQRFEKAVDLILSCQGAILTSGVGKAGIIARKLAATLASTGTPSHFLNPGDALHGDVGAIRKGDLIIVLSYSGESDEILRILSVVKKLDHPVIAITSGGASSLGRHADLVLPLGKIEEACPLGLAPSATTTAMLALGDALALTVMKERHFTSDDFALFHPAGQLGRKLIKVKEVMTFRRGENLPVASERLNVRQVLHEVSTIRRRSGAVILVDEQGRLAGIFSDSDLRRLLTDQDDTTVLSRPIRDLMTKNPKRVLADALASEAMGIMKQHRIDELPVVDESNRPVGLVDVQDLVVLKLFDVDEKG